MRLFTAIDLPEDLRTRLAILLDQLRPLGKLQWSRPEKLHITTAFIGEWPEARLDELYNSLTQLTGSPIPIHVSGLYWATKHVLAAGVDRSPALTALASATTRALASLGHPLEEREYHPHLTLARRKHRRPIPEVDRAISENEALDFGTFLASDFALFLSHEGKYTQLKEYVLSK